MLKIRLARAGAIRQPFYRIVVSPDLSPRDGRFVEQLGFFNPVARGQEERLRLDATRAAEWVARGARPTERVAALIKEARRNTPAEPETSVETVASSEA